MAAGDMSRMLGRYKDALTHYSDALVLSRKIGDKSLQSDAAIGMGLALRGMGLWRDALRCFGRAGRHLTGENDLPGKAFLCWAEAGAWRYRGLPLKAIELLKETLSISKRLKDREMEGFSLNALGGASRVAGLNRESLRYYERANRIFTGRNDSFGKAYSHCGIGNAYRMYGDYGTAMSHFRKALVIYKRIGDIVSSAYTLWSIGQNYTMLGRTKLSERYYLRSRELFRKTGDVRGMVYFHLGMGQECIQKGEFKKASGLLKKSLETAAEYGFLLEQCHSRQLIRYLDRVKSGKVLTPPTSSCYNRLGVNIRFDGVPFNIP
ncbi:tetratricopeptide repeat protein [bacterium BMS3Bbin06]|nr:tetratricopeptide repeat protein [bacterium BMS3Abin08]GBE34899.1 tetratricopeptide repeat protein [bacterium BMS3Bbin06]